MQNDIDTLVIAGNAEAILSHLIQWHMCHPKTGDMGALNSKCKVNSLMYAFMVEYLVMFPLQCR